VRVADTEDGDPANNTGHARITPRNDLPRNDTGNLQHELGEQQADDEPRHGQDELAQK
jgi:hypothetical protein